MKFLRTAICVVLLSAALIAAGDKPITPTVLPAPTASAYFCPACQPPCPGPMCPIGN